MQLNEYYSKCVYPVSSSMTNEYKISLVCHVNLVLSLIFFLYHIIFFLSSSYFIISFSFKSPPPYSLWSLNLPPPSSSSLSQPPTSSYHPSMSCYFQSFTTTTATSTTILSFVLSDPYLILHNLLFLHLLLTPTFFFSKMTCTILPSRPQEHHTIPRKWVAPVVLCHELCGICMQELTHPTGLQSSTYLSK
jgi:hypothetical protein